MSRTIGGVKRPLILNPASLLLITMKTLDIIKKLREQGHRVAYRKRTDGGIRITSIDGQKFKNSQGNARARTLTGNALSIRQTTQLNRNRRSIQLKSGRPKGKVSAVTLKKIRSVQRKFRKSSETETITQSNYLWIEQNYGKEEAERRLREAERRASRLAYSQNIRVLGERMAHDFQKIKGGASDYFQKTIKGFVENYEAIEITDDELMALYAELYKVEQGQQSVDDFELNFKKIFNK